MSRTRIAAAALALVTTAAAGALLTLAPAQAAAPLAAAVTRPLAAAVPTTVTGTDGTPGLVVDPTTGLADSGASITVTGAMFDKTKDLYIGVCAADMESPDALTDCVGGAIPDANPSKTAWADISPKGDGQGGVTAKWVGEGGFNIKLTLPSVTDGAPNCLTGGCALYTVYADGAGTAAPDGLKPVALTFAEPPPPTSSSSAPPTAPGTAIVQSVGSADIIPGGTQNVIFSGFRADEQVNLTLFSAPVTLSPVTADDTGVAQVSFVVPADFAVGTHRLEAIGQASGTVGVATFQVIAPPPSPSPTPSPSPSPTPSPSPSPSSTAVSSSAPASTAVSSSAAPAPADDEDTAAGLWWLWLILGIVVLAGIITAVVVYRRRQEEQREQDEQAIADAAAQQPTASAPPGGPTDYLSNAPTVFLPPVQATDGPPPGADPYGLLSGRDHPDNTSLYSGQDAAGPTQIIGPQPPGQGGPGPYGQPLGYGGPEQGYPQPTRQTPPAVPDALAGPPTEAMPPSGPGGTDGGSTQAWAPDFDDTDTGGSGDGSGGSDTSR